MLCLQNAFSYINVLPEHILGDLKKDILQKMKSCKFDYDVENDIWKCTNGTNTHLNHQIISKISNLLPFDLVLEHVQYNHHTFANVQKFRFHSVEDSVVVKLHIQIPNEHNKQDVNVLFEQYLYDFNTNLNQHLYNDNIVNINDDKHFIRKHKYKILDICISKYLNDTKVIHSTMSLNFYTTCYDADAFLQSNDIILNKEEYKKITLIFNSIQSHIIPYIKNNDFEKLRYIDKNDLCDYTYHACIVIVSNFLVEYINYKDNQGYLELYTPNDIFPTSYMHLDNSCVVFPSDFIFRKKSFNQFTTDLQITIDLICKKK